ncbi:tight junction protein ZO-2-like isoform X1 [Lates japonicus]|uniref:Tight junction protein ZO-2-like isoform X1 n=1 Tax=Lates japonicus TaxID=270547 RepID=A0AAD3R484_LATJO|nr:tight junction protein ZO-2-like isoform X1 [Lates japonicus]
MSFVIRKQRNRPTGWQNGRHANTAQRCRQSRGHALQAERRRHKTPPDREHYDGCPRRAAAGLRLAEERRAGHLHRCVQGGQRRAEQEGLRRDQIMTGGFAQNLQCTRTFEAPCRGVLFFIRTHFEYEKEAPELFSRGEIFKVTDTLTMVLGNHNDKDNQLLEKGIIPNKSTGKSTEETWRLRGQEGCQYCRSARAEEDLSASPGHRHYPAHERVVTRRGGLDSHDDRIKPPVWRADYLSMDSRFNQRIMKTRHEGGAEHNELDETLDVFPARVAISRSPEPVPGFHPEPCLYEEVRAQTRTDSSRSYDSHSSSTISSDAVGGNKPLPPPVALKPTVPRLNQHTEEQSPGKKEEDPANKSFLGKIQAFEKMDHLARAQRLLELQEAENARLEIAQKHPDIYAIPVKLPKPNLNRPQPIGSSSNPEPQTPSRTPYAETRGHDDDDEAEYRRQLADQTKRGYYNPQKYKDTEL